MLGRRLFQGNDTISDIGSPVPSQSDNIDETKSPVMKNGNATREEHNAIKLSKQDSDSDSDFNNDFFSDVGKIPYTQGEDELILKYVLKGQNILRTSSVSLWKQLEVKKHKPVRTYQSLKNRFLRNIKPNIFMKFRHLVQDEETAKKILSKFPELNRSYRHMQASQVLNVKNVNCKATALSAIECQSSEKNSNSREVFVRVEPDFKIAKCLRNSENNSIRRLIDISTETPVEAGETSLKEKTSISKKAKLPVKLPNPFLENGSGCKNITLKGNNIVITFRNDLMDGMKDYNQLGIYEKYLLLKSKNRLTECQHCGRGEPELNPDIFCDRDEEPSGNGNEQCSDNVNSAQTPTSNESTLVKIEEVTTPANEEKTKNNKPRKEEETPNAENNLSQKNKQVPSGSKRKHTLEKFSSTRSGTCFSPRNPVSYSFRGSTKEEGSDDSKSQDNDDFDEESLFENLCKYGRKLNEYLEETDDDADENSLRDQHCDNNEEKSNTFKMEVDENAPNKGERKSGLLENMMNMLSRTRETREK